ncbi:SRPBCC family protein [Naasia aerilata]|uniref:Polyketide cyclase/dehydrase/lipid transport protein n=1 Tax=Naasia aerilata TaxID=1162966 RepID=A0ABN6XP95_9MICO|nr:SRPBCC family protein [Naasia aerilata]BDZ46822.1 hypothetical protein GCM10025866_27310 [Naasia aerilata]
MIELATGAASSTASPDAFFARWVDHASWSSWSPDTEWVKVGTPVRVGTRGVLKPKGGPKVRFFVSACEPGREYTDTSLLPGARLLFQHLVEPTPSGSALRVRVWVEGPLGRIWAKVMGGGFRQTAQADLDRLVALVERA